MPSLICSSRYTIDSQILRRTAQQLGWETLRLDGNRIPSWFDPPDNDFAFFYTAPHVFDISKQVNRKMLGCNPDWTVNLRWALQWAYSGLIGNWRRRKRALGPQCLCSSDWAFGWRKLRRFYGRLRRLTARTL